MCVWLFVEVVVLSMTLAKEKKSEREECGWTEDDEESGYRYGFARRLAWSREKEIVWRRDRHRANTR